MINLSNIPTKPGVYIFKDKNNNVLYVGKAKNLKKRISSYFQKSKSESFWKDAMKLQINDVEYTVVNNEKEAILLELNQIKNLNPKYNIKLKDDKNYCFVKISNNIYPKIDVVRNNYDKNAIYLGPFVSSYDIHELLKIISFYIPFCTCKTYLKSPCIRYYLNLCKCPAVTKITPEEYKKNIQLLINFFNGDTKYIKEEINKKMDIAIKNYDFESAIKYRDTLNTIDNLITKQFVVSNKNVDFHVINMQDINNYKSNSIFVCVLKFKDGKMVDKDIRVMKVNDDYLKQDNLVSIILFEFVKQYYQDIIPPKNIIVPKDVEIYKNSIKHFFDIKSYKTNIEYISKGNKQKYLNIAMLNANEQLLIKSKNVDYIYIINNLKEYLGIKYSINRIECYDVSHLSGIYTNVSMVVFIDGLLQKKHYRRFKINCLNNGVIDDYASLKEAIVRRLNHIGNDAEDISLNSKPDLIIIDGGIGHLSCIKDIITDIPIISIAKKNEDIYTIKNNKIIKLDLNKDNPINCFIQQLRNESHRFANKYVKTKKSKEFNKSKLDEIYGIGKKKKNKLLNCFGSVENIKNASDEELLKIINKKDLSNIREYLN